MNISSSSSNSTPAVVRDDLTHAVLKNVITLVLCISINYINATLVHTFIKHETFNLNPRYILYIHLVINDIILLIMLTTIHVLSYIVFTLNVSLCIVLIILAIFTNMNNPLTLAVMAIECYIAICFPLHHSQICTVKKTYIVICLIWVLSLLSVVPDLFVSLATESYEFFHLQVFCLRDLVFRNPKLAEKRDISHVVLFLAVCFVLLYTYFKILFAAQSASPDAKKARNTILLHSFQLILSMMNYLNSVITAGLTYLFPKSVLAIRFSVTILVNIMPRLVCPLVYGIRDKSFRKYLKHYLLCKKNNKTDF